MQRKYEEYRTRPQLSVPNYPDPTICDSQGALAYSSTGLANEIDEKIASTTLIGYSMGAAVIRGYLTLAQSRLDDTSLKKIDTVITIQGAHNGTYLPIASEYLAGQKGGETLLNKVLSAVASYSLDLEDDRPALQDMTPTSDWYQSVTTKPVPEHINYYNFYSDITLLGRPSHFFIPKREELATVIPVGDMILLLGDERPTSTPRFGGARFLPYGEAANRHEYVLYNDHTFLWGDENANSLLRAIELGVSQTVAVIQLVVFDPINHINLHEHIDDTDITIPSCRTQIGSVTILAEIKRILRNPGSACD